MHRGDQSGLHSIYEHPTRHKVKAADSVSYDGISPSKFRFDELIVSEFALRVLRDVLPLVIKATHNTPLVLNSNLLSCTWTTQIIIITLSRL